MNFGIVFCAVGGALWIVQFILRVTEYATRAGELPRWEEYKNCIIDERARRNSRAIKIGALFFFLFGIFGWSITVGEPGVYLNDQQLIYGVGRLLLPLLLYLNVSMRLLIYRLSGGAIASSLRVALAASFKATGIFPDGNDMPSNIVRWTNILFVLVMVLIGSQIQT